MSIQSPVPDSAASYALASNEEPAIRPIIYDQPWLTSLARPLLVIVLVACLDAALVTLIGRIAQRPGTSIVFWLLGLTAAIVGCVTSSILAQPAQRHRRTFGYRFAEVGLLVLLARVVLWLTIAPPTDLSALMIRPIDVILDGWFWVAIFVVVISWTVASEMSDDLLKLALQPDELYVAQHHYDRLGEVARTSGTNRTQIMQWFVARWVSLGLLMILLAALVRRDLPQSLNFAGAFSLLRREVETGVALAILGYFLSGLLLIGLSRLAMLRARWTLEKIPAQISVLQQWPSYVALLVVGMGVLAALLPLGDTFLLARLLNWLIWAVMTLLMAIQQFFMFLLLLLLSPLLGDAPPPSSAAAAAAPAALPPPPPVAESALPAWTGGAIFWLIMLFILGNALLIYFGGKRLQLSWLDWLLQTLRSRLAQLFRPMRRLRQRLRIGNQATKTSGVDTELETIATLNPAHLTNIEQVRYYYLATLEKAEKVGTPRHQAESPLHYAPRLKSALSEATLEAITGEVTIDEATSENQQAPPGQVVKSNQANNPASSALRGDEGANNNDDISLLTEAFIQIRYAGNRINSEMIERLRHSWHSLEQRLQQARQSKK